MAELEIVCMVEYPNTTKCPHGCKLNNTNQQLQAQKKFVLRGVQGVYQEDVGQQNGMNLLHPNNLALYNSKQDLVAKFKKCDHIIPQVNILMARILTAPELLDKRITFLEDDVLDDKHRIDD